MEYFSVTSATFAVTATPLLLLAYNVPYLHLQCVQLLEETTNGLLNQVSAWSSLFLGDLPTYVILSLIYAGITRGMLGYEGSAGAYISAIVSTTLCFYSLSVCCAASASSTVHAGLNYLRACGLCLLFAGYFETIPNLSTFWNALTFVSPSRWAFESLMLDVYDDMKNVDVYFSLYGFDGGEIGTGVTWLLVWFAGLTVLALLLMSPLSAKISRGFQIQKERTIRQYTAPTLSSPEAVSNEDSKFDNSPNPTVLSFPELRRATGVGAEDGGVSGSSEGGRRKAQIGRIPDESQMTLTFRQVSYITTDGESSGRESSRSMFFADSSTVGLGPYGGGGSLWSRKDSEAVELLMADGNKNREV